MAEDGDPWASVRDIDGDAHYRVLGLLGGRKDEPNRKANAEEIRAAYVAKARQTHPDKQGGDAAMFAQVKEAYDTLIDPARKKAYDDWQKELKYRYVRGVAPRMEGGEDLLLDEFEKLGLSCDPSCQLVVTCEVCGRPSTWDCHICGLHCCDFCGRKQHWKGAFGLHWPMHNVPGMMAKKLAERQLEKKRVDDAKRLALADPNHRTDTELEALRAFKDAACEVDALPRDVRLRHFDLRLAKHYMWTQTQRHVYIALAVPTGYRDRPLHVESDGVRITVQAEKSPASIDRAFGGAVARNAPIESFMSDDNRLMCISLEKAEIGDMWRRLFDGDSDGVRALEPPYRLYESTDEVVFELEVPFWIDAEDVDVRVTLTHLEVNVRNQYRIKRTFWRNASREHEERKGGDPYPGPVDPAGSAWSLDDEVDANGEPIKVVMVHIAKPPRTATELRYDTTTRSDNLNFRRRDGQGTGTRFFVEDEDEFFLEEVLAALTFLEAGAAYVRRKPWHYKRDGGDDPGWVTNADALPERARTLLESLLEMGEAEEDDGAFDPM